MALGQFHAGTSGNNGIENIGHSYPSSKPDSSLQGYKYFLSNC